MQNTYHWHPASTPPPDDRTVIIATAERVGDSSTPQIWFGYYSRQHHEWLSIEGSVINVLHWTCLPPPPSISSPLPSREGRGQGEGSAHSSLVANP